MHIPVLLNEVIRFLDPKPGEFIIDATVDGGGYAAEIIKKISPAGKFLGIDWDKNILKKATTALQHPISDFQLQFKNDNYANLPEILEKLGWGKADGLVLDLGFSSEQLENSGRGFSFRRDEPLIMIYSDEEEPVRELLKKMKEEELAAIIKNFGEERFAKRIARAIREQEKKKPIETSGELARIISDAVPRNYEKGRMHPATRTFQALRIYANKELQNLEMILKNLKLVLNPSGRAVIVSFHSLEDRLVKNYFRDLKKIDDAEILTKKPVTPSREEFQENPRSRSAKLRAVKLI
ncbi:MAG TPA: 16S rRNA (cytosine(1402)-N(4))-methyltransferase RsmH [Candidatus Paceibacterota bacterium]